MAFYENTIVAKQDITQQDLKALIDKYSSAINDGSGKVIKIEEWGLINLSKKIDNYKKGFFIHFKFEGINKTLEIIKSKIKVDRIVIRNLIVKYKKLDKETEYFKRNN